MKPLVIVLTRQRIAEMRCEHCNALLYRVLGKSVAAASFNIEIKCKRCGHFNRGGAWSEIARKEEALTKLERKKEII